MNITFEDFGKTKYGEIVKKYTIKNALGGELSVLDYGCTVQAIKVPDKNGNIKDVCLGYDTLIEYEENDAYLGAVVGRYANRIGKGRFVLDGKKYTLAINNGSNHNHGGLRGFDKYVWSCDVKGDCLVFSRISPHMEEGYPGCLEVFVKVSFTDKCSVVFEYFAKTDAKTIINLTNHSYFNLSGQGSGSVYNQFLQINADCITETDETSLPTGRFLDVSNTPFDFRTEKKIGQDINQKYYQIMYGNGYDHNFVINHKKEWSHCAVAFSEETGIELKLYTTKPGVQLYTANYLEERRGKNNTIYRQRDGFCLETQFFPDSINHKCFPSPVLETKEEYRQKTEYAFGIRDRNRR